MFIENASSLIQRKCPKVARLHFAAANFPNSPDFRRQMHSHKVATCLVLENPNYIANFSSSIKALLSPGNVLGKAKKFNATVNGSSLSRMRSEVQNKIPL